MTDASTKTPWHLWLVGVIALLFNAIGVIDFVMTRLQGAHYMEGAGMTPAQIALYQAMPAWMIVIWGIGVFTALIASILLLARRRLAFPIFATSLAAFLINLLYIYGLGDGGAVMGKQMAITNVVIVALLAFFIWYARWMSARGVLR